MSVGSQAIGIFDSGVGGLTVLKELQATLPTESFYYLGDTARLPYGSKSPATIERYVQQNIKYLLAQNVKAIVVACNTASGAVIGKDLGLSIPLYNVIEPGAKFAHGASNTKRIGVVGTRATVSGRAYVNALQAIDPQVQVWSQACPLLVPLVEEGWDDDPITNLVLFRYLQPLVSQGIDTLILGCTHYPALRSSFAKVVGPHISLVDSAASIASIIKADLANGTLVPRAGGTGDIVLTATDVSSNLQQIAKHMLSPLSPPEIQLVDITS